MNGLWRRADDVLRGRPHAGTWPLLLICGLGYGAVMGSFGGPSGQVGLAALKVPLLLVATLALGLPSFFVLHTLLGLRADFPEAFRAVAASQAGLTIVLASLAPLTAFWYASSDDYAAAILFNAAMFGAASVGAQTILWRSYRPLLARNPKHRWLLRTWLGIYALVGIQMGWLLRPFVGSPDMPVRFFQSGPMENAYVVVGRLVWGVLSR